MPGSRDTPGVSLPGAGTVSLRLEPQSNYEIRFRDVSLLWDEHVVTPERR